MSDLDRALADAREYVAKEEKPQYRAEVMLASLARERMLNIALALLAEHERANTEHAMRLEDLEDVARLTDERDANAAGARRCRDWAVDAAADALSYQQEKEATK